MIQLFRLPESCSDAVGFLYGNPEGAAVVYLPPFAEEANKSRRMASLQARRFLDVGVSSLLLDFSGTGESSADFSEACWARWSQEVQLAVDGLKRSGVEEVWLWGLRTGATLALDCVHSGGLDVAGLLLWQPVLSGSAFVRQFLRQRVAAGVVGGVDRENVRDLMDGLRAGVPIEVSGYEVSPDLMLPLSELEWKKPPQELVCPVRWFEIIPDPEYTSASLGFARDWESSCDDVDVFTICGDPFWKTAEITVCHELIDSTAAMISPKISERR